jgi:hypothetical protein
VQSPQDYYAAAPATDFLGRAPVVVMNTNYGDPRVKNYVKKNKQSGRSNLLKGYTVGSRAPATAIRSGTNNQYGYGIGNLYGGKARTQARIAETEGLPTSFSVGGGGRATNNSLTTTGPALLALGVLFLLASLK